MKELGFTKYDKELNPFHFNKNSLKYYDLWIRGNLLIVEDENGWYLANVSNGVLSPYISISLSRGDILSLDKIFNK